MPRADDTTGAAVAKVARSLAAMEDAFREFAAEGGVRLTPAKCQDMAAFCAHARVTLETPATPPPGTGQPPRPGRLFTRWFGTASRGATP